MVHVRACVYRYLSQLLKNGSCACLCVQIFVSVAEEWFMCVLVCTDMSQLLKNGSCACLCVQIFVSVAEEWFMCMLVCTDICLSC